MHDFPFIIRGHVIQDTRVDVNGMFSLGDKFKSFDELQAKVHRYEELEFVKLWNRDSLTVRPRRIDKSFFFRHGLTAAKKSA